VLQISFSTCLHFCSGTSLGTDTFTCEQCFCGCKSHNSIGCSIVDWN
jgi:hypothetical protein